MFELASRVSLGMDVADFFQLQSTFQSDGVMQTTSQEQGVLFAGKVLRPGNELRLQGQHALQRHGQVAHGLQVLRLISRTQSAFGLGQRQGEQEQSSQLRGERFGGGHANFYTCTGDVGQRAFAHHGRGGHIANGQGVLHAQGLRMAQCRQGVGGFTRLADGDHQAARVGHRGAVTVFAGDFHLARHVGDALQPVLGDATAVVTGAAGQDQYRINLFKHLGGLTHLGRSRVVKQVGHDALNAFERVGNGTRLLEDFFLHVVAVRAQLGRTAVGMHGLHLALNGLV